MTDRPAESRDSTFARTGRCWSGWPTGCWARSATPRTWCRRPGCAGPGWTRTRCADPPAFLVRTVSRLALDRLRRVAARRETYVGPWLPEPVLTGGPDRPIRRDPAEDASAPSRSRWRCSSCWRRCPRWSARCSCCTRRSPTPTARSRRSSTAARRRCASSPTGRGSTCRPAGRGSRPTRPSGGPPPSGSCAPALGGDLAALLELLAPDATLWADGGGQGEGAAAPDPRRGTRSPGSSSASPPSSSRRAARRRSSRSTEVRRRCCTRPGRAGRRGHGRTRPGHRADHRDPADRQPGQDVRSVR